MNAFVEMDIFKKHPCTYKFNRTIRCFQKGFLLFAAFMPGADNILKFVQALPCKQIT